MIGSNCASCLSTNNGYPVQYNKPIFHRIAPKQSKTTTNSSVLAVMMYFIAPLYR